MTKDHRALLWGEVYGREPQPFELDRTNMDLADIQKAMICIGLDSLQRKAPELWSRPQVLFARARWSTWAWSRAKFRRDRQVGLRGSPRGGLLMRALFPRRWFPVEGTRIPFLESPPGYYLSSACTARKWSQERRNTAWYRHLSPSEPCVLAPLRRRERRFECRSSSPFFEQGPRRRPTCSQ